MTENNYRILIVEDDEVDVRLIHRYLKDQLSCEFEEVRTLAEALRALEAEAFDCVLLDYRLPDGQSTERFHELVDAAQGNTAFILLTGMAEEEMNQQDHSFDACLIKGQLEGKQLSACIQKSVEVKKKEKRSLT